MSAKKPSLAALVLLALCGGVGLAVWADAANAKAPAQVRSADLKAAPRAPLQSGAYSIAASLPLTTPTPPAGPPDLVGVIYQVSSCQAPTLRLITMNIRIPRTVPTPSTMRLENRLGDFVEFPVPSGFFYTHQVDCQIGTCVTADWASALPFTLTVDYYNTVVEEVETNNTAGLSTLTPCQTSTPIATFTNTPTPTSTRVVDLAGLVTWTNTCTATVILRMETYINGPTFMRTAVPSYMRAQNSAGDFQDFPVPRLDANTPSYTFDCVLGSCLPSSWATAIPITLTVDVFNQVFEHDETNNISTMNWPPPMPTPCPPTTVTPTHTPSQQPTGLPDLVGQLSWISVCPAPVLRVTTRNALWPHYVNFASTMRLVNNSGDFREFPVPPFFSQQEYSVDCELGSCIPSHWVTSLPFTLTVDYYNTVPEQYENNNIFTLAFPPPMPTPCLTSTPTPTPPNTSTATATTTSCSITFSDVHPTDYFYEAVRYLYCDGDISGYGDGTFRPYNNTNRGQTVKIVVLGFNIPIYQPPPPQPCTFRDACTDNPFHPYIETAAHHELVSGYADGTFRPFNLITRGQLAKIVVLAAQMVRGWMLINPPTPTFSDVAPGTPFYEYIETAACYGVLSGYADGTFRPFNNATRGQIAKIVHLAYTGTLGCNMPSGPSNTRGLRAKDGGAGLLPASSYADFYSVQASVPLTTTTPSPPSPPRPPPHLAP